MSSDWIDSIVSAWKGHRTFAEFIVKHMKPKVVVELGVDFGFSSFVFANALQNTDGKHYGIDMFQGDMQTGFRNTYDSVMENIASHGLTNIEIIVGEFGEVAKSWYLPIQILHIDGLHTYEAVKGDYDHWSPFVDENSIILFHDVTAFPEIAQFFRDVEDGWQKLYFTHSAGLGILTKNTELKDEILKHFDNVFNHDTQPL
jgi:predicted O-methyltransferase YrrM